MNIFISYAREDLVIARRIYADLKLAGLSPWLDVENLLPGQRWKTAVREAITDSTYFVAILSSRSVSKKGYVQNELKLALDILGEFPPTKIFVIPAKLDECQPTEETLRDLHWADFSISYETGITQILRVLAPPAQELNPKINVFFPYTLWNSDPVKESLRISLGREIAKGGEASIYEVRNLPLSIAKIYHTKSSVPEEKLKYMMTHPPVGLDIQHGHTSVPWVNSLIKDNIGNTIGYEMPFIRGGVLLYRVYTPKLRRKLSFSFTWKDLHTTARSLAATVRAIHNAGYVIGDLSASNILVHRPGLITILDADSFQVQTPAGTVHRCKVGRVDFTPPELSGVDFANVDRTELHDRFALGVLLFLLLMEGTHPFHGNGKPTLLSERIRIGLFVHCSQHESGLRPPEKSLLFTELHPKLQDLFLKCFVEGYSHPSNRPTAHDWEIILAQVEEDLVQCRQNIHHFYNPFLQTCTWCRRAEILGAHDPFPCPAPMAFAFDFVENFEQRCPVVLIIDTSDSTQGTVMNLLVQSLRSFQEQIQSDALAALRIEIAIITFGPDVHLAQEFVTADEFSLPAFSASGPRPMGEAVDMAIDMIKVRKTQYRAAGMPYYRPWILLLSNGAPTDDTKLAAERVKAAEARRELSFLAVTMTDEANLQALENFSDRRAPLSLRHTDFSSFFQWLSVSFAYVTHSREGNSEELPSFDVWSSFEV